MNGTSSIISVMVLKALTASSIVEAGESGVGSDHRRPKRHTGAGASGSGATPTDRDTLRVIAGFSGNPLACFFPVFCFRICGKK
jgi:hypothetical protein